jgi:UDP-N-acetylglucosamine transferase subunit ALG13
LIFVTVGTSLPHDELIEKLDDGSYVPRHIKSFRFRKGLDEYLRNAEIVISNCGAGTIMENVTKGHKLVVIQNPDITGGHEWELVTKMENGGHLIWCRNLESLQASIDRAKKTEFKRFNPKRLDFKEVLSLVFND